MRNIEYFKEAEQEYASSAIGIRELAKKYNFDIGFSFCKYLYENSTIHLQRKYERYLQYCRLY